MVGWAFGFGVGGLGLVGRGLCWKVWGWWVRVGQWWFVLLGLGLVGWGWSVLVCACRYGMGGVGQVSSGLCFEVGGLGLVGRGLCMRVWSSWVGVGQWWFVLLRLGLVPHGVGRS